VIEYLRLAFGTACVLLPGWAVMRAVGQRGASALVAWTLACVFAAWAVVFAVHASIRVAAVILAVIFVASVTWKVRRGVEAGSHPGRTPGPVLLGVVLGWALWAVAGAVVGDGLFHEARVRKLVHLGDLHLRTVDEFKDGGLHPGYAFPLWHAFLALVSFFSGVDPDGVLRHEPSLLAPVACAVAYEAGVALFRARGGGIAVLLAQLATFAFAPGHGGSWALLAQPGTASRQILVPSALTLVFSRRMLPAALAFGALTLVHATYALFLFLPLLVLLWWEWRTLAAALAPVVPALAWLRPLVNETNSHNPGPVERANELKLYADQLVVSSPSHFRLSAEVPGRSGAAAVAALALIPLAALALRRRWGAYVLGGSVLVLALMLVPWLFVHLSDGVSLSQARRAAGFAPLPFAFAGGLALVVRRASVLPLALVAGLIVQHEWPGDFGYGLRHGGPALVTWFALVGGAGALVAALALKRPELRPRFGLGAAAAFVYLLPVFVHGLAHWSPAVKADPGALSPRLVHNLRTRVPKGAIVLAPVQTSYRVAAAAPVYVVAAPVNNVANTKANDPYGRARAVRHWVATNDPAVARRYGATWAIRSGRLYRLPR
jgi:hypothetical protein